MRNDLTVILSCFQRLLAVLIHLLVNLFRLIDPFSFRRYLVIMTKFKKDEDGGVDDVPLIYMDCIQLFYFRWQFGMMRLKLPARIK